jgi:hypothetical protein
MITQTEVMPLLLQACPGFLPRWKEHLAYWGKDERGIFNDTSEFALYVVDSYSRGNVSEFADLFSLIDRILAQGDEEARGIATVGVLESIQVVASNQTFGAQPFVQWLGPLSRQAWEEIDELWRKGGGSLAGVIRAEKRNMQRMRKRWWQFWR